MNSSIDSFFVSLSNSDYCSEFEKKSMHRELPEQAVSNARYHFFPSVFGFLLRTYKKASAITVYTEQLNFTLMILTNIFNLTLGDIFLAHFRYSIQSEIKHLQHFTSLRYLSEDTSSYILSISMHLFTNFPLSSSSPIKPGIQMSSLSNQINIHNQFYFGLHDQYLCY